jgi:hypothetical protein
MPAADELRQTVSAVLYVCDDLERRGYLLTGTLRRAARLLIELEDSRPRPGTCTVCGGPVEQPATGRRRTYCSRPCRRRANRG